MPPRPVNLETLAALAAGELDPGESAAIREALRHDLATLATLDRMRTAIATMRSDDSSTPSMESIERTKSAVARVLELARRNGDVAATGPWWRSAIESLARLVYDSRAQPAMGLGFRGGAETRQMTFVASEGRDELELDLQIGPAAASGAADGRDRDELHSHGEHHDIGERCRVLGQLSPVNADGPRCDDRAVVALRSGTLDPVARVVTDGGGVFALSLPPGRYDFACDIGDDNRSVAITLRGVDVP